MEDINQEKTLSPLEEFEDICDKIEYLPTYYAGYNGINAANEGWKQQKLIEESFRKLENNDRDKCEEDYRNAISICDELISRRNKSQNDNDLIIGAFSAIAKNNEDCVIS